MTMGSVHVEEEPRQPREEATFTRKEPVAADNRRVNPRYGVELDVTMSSDHNFYAGFAENISTGGLFIATHLLKPVGEHFEISLTLPGQQEPIRGIGEVRWVREYSERSNTPPGMGIRFVSLSPGAADAIDRFLKDRQPLFYDDE
jgi:uncharacterized protein (TIGR02266 family)